MKIVHCVFSFGIGGAETMLIDILNEQDVYKRQKIPGVKVFMALGATIDFEAGTLKRAPKIWQTIGMEWLYRCMKAVSYTHLDAFIGFCVSLQDVCSIFRMCLWRTDVVLSLIHI